MRRNQIKSALERKFQEWVASIDDFDVRMLVSANSIITGGCIPSMLLDEKVHDYDVYFTNKETTLAVAKYYTEKYSSDCDTKVGVLDTIPDGEDLPRIYDPDRVYLMIPDGGLAHYIPTDDEVKNEVKYLPKVFTCNAITLTDGMQLITRFFGDHEQIHDNFDFVHCMCYWEANTGMLVLPSEALESILAKQLIYRGSKYPMCSIFRTKKFIKRDWNITAGEYLKMGFQLSLLDLTDIDVLTDQLVGVDTAYMSDVIDRLQSITDKSSSLYDEITRHQGFDSMLVTRIVDEIFN